MKPKTKLTGHIVVPGDPLYNSARTEFNIRFSKFPGVIVFCLKVQDVINGVKWARERGVPLRVRSGRHSYEGFSTVNGGIVIDVSPLNKVQVDRRKGIAKVGAGADLEHLYKELWRRGVTIPGGTCPTVGIAGLTLGGGIGFLSRLLGLTCDRLLAVDMVIASGKQDAKLIHIDRKNNSDLFWASCGGGGGNFGIATSFTFKVHPISNVSIYRIAWNWNDIREVLKAWQQLAPFVDRRLTSTIQLGAKQSGTVTSMGQFVGPVTQLRRLIQPLLKAGTPIKAEILTVPFIKAVEIFSNLDPRHPHDFENTGVFVNRPLPDQAIQTICFFLQNAPNKNAGVGGMGLGGAVSQIPSRASAYFHRKAKFALQITTSWQNDREAKKNIRWAHSFRKALQPFTTGDYVNWPDLAIKNWPRSYYGDNYHRLQKIKKKYDPFNIFSFPQSIRPTGKLIENNK